MSEGPEGVGGQSEGPEGVGVRESEGPEGVGVRVKVQKVWG